MELPRVGDSTERQLPKDAIRPTGADAPAAAPEERHDPDVIGRLPIRERPRWLMWSIFALGGLFILFLLQGFLRKRQLQLGVFRTYIFNDQILQGLRLTIELGVVSMLLALVLAILVAIMRLSSFPPIRAFAVAYVWFFRMLPLLVLLIIIYNIAIIYPAISVGVPFGPVAWSGNTKALISPFWVAVIAFAVSESAAASEIMRTSILSVARGQWEAAKVLGMTGVTTYRLVVLPQAIRIAVPPLFNDFINNLKSTALVAFIGVFDLFYTTQTIYEQNYEIVPLLMVMTTWYLVIIFVANVIQIFLERRYNQRLGKLGERR